jgi:hypothetical protein
MNMMENFAKYNKNDNSQRMEMGSACSMDGRKEERI